MLPLILNPGWPSLQWPWQGVTVTPQPNSPKMIIKGFGSNQAALTHGMGQGLDIFPALSLVNAIPLTTGEIRVRFSTPPLSVSNIGPNDALNLANYTLTGPTTAPLLLATSLVVTDPQSIDLSLSATLPLGTWTITAKNIQTEVGTPLTAPFSASFTVTSIGPTSTVSLGSVSDTPSDIIRKHLNPAIKGPSTDALIAALATGDQTNFNNASSIFDQLFISSASGIYLARRAADFRVQQPVNVGITDDTFRKLAIKTKTKKVVTEAILEILEVFYGSDALRAHAVTTAPELYALNDGDDLQILVDERITVQVIFHDSDFSQIQFARANEVAAAITRALRVQGTKAFAIPFVDPSQGTGARVKIFSGSLGLSSFLRITGGKAQNALLFPTQLSSVYLVTF